MKLNGQFGNIDLSRFFGEKVEKSTDTDDIGYQLITDEEKREFQKRKDLEVKDLEPSKLKKIEEVKPATFQPSKDDFGMSGEPRLKDQLRE